MTREQKELLYQIASWHSKEFYNRMDDHWTDKNVKFDSKCHEIINRLEKEYQDKYGELPEWKYINNVWDTIQELEKELRAYE